MKTEVINTIVTYTLDPINGVAIDNGKINRGRAFKLAFDRVELVYGKVTLTDEVKRQLRNEIDAKLKEIATLSKAEVVKQLTGYTRVTNDLQLEAGRRVITIDTTVLTPETEVVKLHGLLLELRGRVARSETGAATESQIRTERRIKNAINTRLYAIEQDGSMSDQMKRVSAYANGQARERIEEKVANNLPLVAAK